MKKFLSMLVVLLALVLLIGCEEGETEETFIVGMECGYAPFNWTESVKTETNYPIYNSNLYAEGYDVQIAKNISEKLNRKLVIKAIDFGGLISALESGQIDAIIAGMSDTEERRANVDFTSSYYRSTHVLVMASDSAYVNGKTLNDFAGANVIGQKETLYDDLIEQLANVNHLTPLGDVPTIITSITSKRADITILEEPVAKGVIQTNPHLTYITLEEGFNVSDEDVCVAIAIRKNETSFQEQINSILNSITETERNTLMEEAIVRNSN